MKYKYFVLDKENNITIKTTKSFDTVYKTCGYRKNTDFDVLRTWDNIEVCDKLLSVSLFGKQVGKGTNANNAEILKTLINKTIYGPVVFVFTYDPDIFVDIDMSIWKSFLEIYLQPTIQEASESEYTFEEELDDSDIEEHNDSINESNEVVYDKGLSGCIEMSNELTYEPYYISSDNE